VVERRWRRGSRHNTGCGLVQLSGGWYFFLNEEAAMRGIRGKRVVSAVFLSLFLSCCSRGGDDGGGVLVSRLAGSWYPAEKPALEKMFAEFAEKAGQKRLENVAALIMPHAGYAYSGVVATHGAMAVKGGKYSRVVIIGPSHRFALRNAVSAPSYKSYRTPLGDVELDLDFIAKLRRSKLVVDYLPAHIYEHSVQMEIPLLQYALGNPKVVPLVCGSLDAETAGKVADLLLSLITPDTLVVVSSDFTHYGPNYGYLPFKDDVAENLKKLDMGAYAEIAEISPDGFRKHVSDTGDTICGRCPIEVLLRMLSKGAESPKSNLLAYDTSGRMMDDYSNSVSYFCVAFTGKWKNATEKTAVSAKKRGGGSAEGRGLGEKEVDAKKDSGMEKKKLEGDAAKDKRHPLSGLDASDRKALLKLARDAIKYALDNRKVPTAEDLGFVPTKAMEKEMGAFVTLKESGMLRGCIGEIIPRRAVWRAVLGEAVNAAFNDRRFPPLAPEEFDKIDIEISVLTPPRKIDSHKKIVIGRDGVILSKNGRSAVFLPQVAPEQGWGVEEMLRHLSSKAGLPADAWKSGAAFEVFQAEVFGEKE